MCTKTYAAERERECLLMYFVCGGGGGGACIYFQSRTHRTYIMTYNKLNSSCHSDTKRVVIEQLIRP